MSTATCAFASQPSRPHRSTFVRPRPSSPPQSTFTPRRRSRRVPGANDVRHRDRVVDRRAVPAVRSAVEARRRSRAAPRPSRRRGPPRAARRSCAGPKSALCVTSSPIIVTSIPLANTRAAASGSAQMLNSAAGVTLPSPMRAAHQHDPLGPRVGVQGEEERDVRQRARSGRASPARRRDRSARKSTACSATGAALGGGSVGPSSPVSPWTYAATNGSRTSGRSAPAATGTSRAADELEHAERVRRRLLERLVAGDRRHAEQLDLRAREREQQRDRVVVARVAVEEDRVVMQYRVYLVRGRQRRLRAGREAAIAPAAQARASASSRRRPSSSETTRHAVNASPAAVPSTASTRGAAARATSFAVLEQDCALRAERHRDERAAWPEHLELVAVHDDEVGRRRSSGTGGRRALSARTSELARRLDRAVGDLELTERRGPRRRPARAASRSRRERRRSGSRRRRRRRSARRPSARRPRRRRARLRLAQADERLRRERVAADAPTNRTSAPSRAAATAWFAPLPPGTRSRNAAP